MNQRLRKNLLNVLTAFMIIAPILLVGSIIFVSVYKGSTKEITAVADQFKPDADWVETNNNVTPPMILCLSDIKCPSVYRSWTANRPVSTDELIEKIKHAGWGNLKIEGDCNTTSFASGTPSGICDAYGTVGEYDVSVGLSATSNEPQKRTIGISIEPKKES